MTNEERNLYIVESWNDVLEGRPADAIPKMNALIDEGGTGFTKRGIAYLLLNEFDEAREDFLRVRNYPPGHRSEEFVGASYWLADRYLEAHTDWLFDFERQRTGELWTVADSAGVINPALIWWSSMRLSKPEGTKEALKYIKKRSKTVAYSVHWAGPIGDLILGKISADDLIKLIAPDIGMNERVKRHRDLSQAYFYIAADCFRNSNMDGYRTNLKKCCEPGDLLSPEYFLARKELSLLDQ